MTHFIIGAGGHGRVIADILAAAGHAPRMVTEEELRRDYNADAGDVVLLGIGDNSTRERVATSLSGVRFGTAIHPSAVIARESVIGEGTVIMAGAVVNPAARIGAHVIINTNSSVDHDCVIEDFASIAPGVALGGNVTLRRAVAVGIGACVVHGCEIGEHTVVGAGAAVVKSLPGFSVVVGVPARVIKSRRPGDKYL